MINSIKIYTVTYDRLETNKIYLNLSKKIKINKNIGKIIFLYLNFLLYFEK